MGHHLRLPFPIACFARIILGRNQIVIKINIGHNFGGGGGSNNKKDHAAGKNPRCPLSYCSFLFFFKTRSKSTFLCRIWSKMCPQKRTKKIMIFVFFDFYVLFCSFLLFLPDLVNKMSSNREQKRTKKSMPPGKSQDVLCLFCCWTPPPKFQF